METKKTCETCKHYDSVELDEFHVHAYRAVMRNSCKDGGPHEDYQPMARYWEEACVRWEAKNEG